MGKTMKNEIPIEVRDYLTAGDGLAQAAVHEQYPNLDQVLNAPTTRSAILRYLSSDEPLTDPSSDLTINALGFLQSAATAKESASIRHLLRHPNPWVRVTTAEYMMAVYYPARDRNSMLTLFKEMLNDTDEVVRVQAARWVKGINAAPDLEGFLENWLALARKNKWDKTESFQMIAALAKH
jgi:hypothetical protein